MDAEVREEAGVDKFCRTLRASPSRCVPPVFDFFAVGVGVPVNTV